MPEFNQNRSLIIKIIFGSVFIIILAQLVNLQLLSPKYKLAAENNAIFRKVIYPDRGIIFDRKHRSLLENVIMFDLVVTPSEIKGTDTLGLCRLLGIDTAEFRKRIHDISIKNSSVRPSVFEPLLTSEMYAKLNENMYRFPGFVLSERSVRHYPFGVAANVLGYIAEVDTGFLRKHAAEGYEMGDYAGMTGLERSYEKILMGRRGIQRKIKDNRNRIQGSYENGAFDTAAVAGKNLYLSLDVKLQMLGEKLMKNKVGSIVAIDPQTGGILCMVSAPSYDPNYLTGNLRRKHFSALYTDPRLPLLNRALGTYYSPGSTFKTFVGIVAMNEHVINSRTTVACNGAYYGCGRRMGCHAAGVFNLKGAIAHSCNTYFATVYRRILDDPHYPSIDSSLGNINRYANSFGLGHKLGVDLPAEKRGNMPTAKFYHKIFGPRWNSCNIVSNAIGQGEILVTLTQLSNLMAIIANKGWYYTPHMVDSIENGDEDGMLSSFRTRHYAVPVPSYIYDIIQDGMEGTMDFGTGAAAQVPGVRVCGKTGTVQNTYHGVKQKDHAFFAGFAPRNHPRIAISVMCENAGFGASSSAPIASLMIEQYLKDSIPEKDRQAQVEAISKINLIPERMRSEMARMDSLKQVKENAGVNDTTGIEKGSDPALNGGGQPSVSTFPNVKKMHTDSLLKNKNEGKNRSGKKKKSLVLMNIFATIEDDRNTKVATEYL